MNRFLPLLVSGALALSAVPAFAEDAMTSESTSSSATSSASSTATSSEKIKSNLGRMIKDKCHKLSGKSRVLCLEKTKLTDRKLPPKMRVKKALKRAIGKNCNEYTKDSAEFKTCMGEQKKIMKEQHPKAAKMMKKMLNQKKGMEDSASSAS